MRWVQRFLSGAVLALILWAGANTRGQEPALTWREIDPRPFPSPMRVSLEVLLDGRPMRTVYHRGKTYLPVPRLGVEYTLRVRNHGPRRVAAVLSVDGLSVISGRPASEDGTGYLVGSYGSIVIPGWRRNMDTVAAFRFVSRDDSYAARVGHPENVGVIGLVAFEERWPMPRLPMEGKGAADRAYAGSAAKAGTGYGRDIDSPAVRVPFERSGRRHAITYHYDTVEALREAGVPVDRYHPVPFPGGFAPPPPGDGRR